MKKIDAVLTKIEEAVLSFSILIMAIILIGGVISRTVFNSSWTFTEEVGIFLNCVVTFFGIGYCAREARHISMSVVYDLTSSKIKKLFAYIITILTALIMVYVAYLGFRYTMSVYNLGRVTAALRIPSWITVVCLPIGFALGAIEYFRTFLLNVLDRKNVHISSKFKLGENMENYDDEKGGIE
ncbi:TRAP transporter small permease [Lachnospiraceae bacterium NSJ-143]|nr:TRAP transporter small permease [Lachnospiraceae bacterium NSJ-143]